MTTYKIIRFREEGANTIIKTGQSLEEAIIHCERGDTHGEDSHGNKWFDGWTAEE